METTEYKPTYEQLEKALEQARRTMEDLVTARSMGHATALYQDAFDNILRIISPPPPTYKEVTVERWECPDCGSVYMVSHGRAEDDPCAKSEPWGDCACSGGRLKEDKATKLTGTRRVPVKQPVRKRVSVPAKVSPSGVSYSVGTGASPEWINHPECHGKTGTLTFEWEE